MRSIYVVFVLGALTCSLSLALWRASAENSRLEQEASKSKMALIAAQDELQDLKARLPLEVKWRRFAEASQRDAESAERSMREQRAEQARAREAAERELRETKEKLAQADEATRAAAIGRQNAEDALDLLKAQLTEETAARKSAEEALFASNNQVHVLTAKLAEEVSAREAAEARSANRTEAQNADMKSEAIVAADKPVSQPSAPSPKSRTRMKAKVASHVHREKKNLSRWSWLSRLIR